MSAKFITGILTAAALITAIAAAPAQAGNNDGMRKIVIGATTLFLLNEVIREIEKGSGRSSVREYHPPRARKAPIPQYCIRKVQGKKHKRRVATRNCLKHNYRAFKRLPKACKTTFWQRGNKRKGYNMRCLRNHGFTVAKRH